jgi:hypothetical protein
MLVDTLIITNKTYMATALNTAVRTTEDGINSATHKSDGIHPEYIRFTICLLMAENVLTHQRTFMYFCVYKLIKFYALTDQNSPLTCLGNSQI